MYFWCVVCACCTTSLITYIATLWSPKNPDIKIRCYVLVQPSFVTGNWRLTFCKIGFGMFLLFCRSILVLLLWLCNLTINMYTARTEWNMCGAISWIPASTFLLVRITQLCKILSKSLSWAGSFFPWLCQASLGHKANQHIFPFPVTLILLSSSSHRSLH